MMGNPSSVSLQTITVMVYSYVLNRGSRGAQPEGTQLAHILVNIRVCGSYPAPTRPLALALVSPALFGHFSKLSNMQTVITEVFPRRYVATLYGLTGATCTLMVALTQSLVGTWPTMGHRSWEQLLFTSWPWK